MNYIKILLICLIANSLHAIDNPHFYRANFFWGEPRFERPWLSSIDINLGGGQADTGRNSNGSKTPLLNIYGLQNMKPLGLTAGLDPANPLDAILINLAALPDNGTFGSLEFTGDFDILEGTFNAYQNFSNGFFAQVYLPFRHIKISKTTTYIDRSPEIGFPNRTTPQWTAFLNNFDAILTRYTLSKQRVNKIGLGDLSFLLGWATTYQGTTCLDYVDVAGKVGILFPTAQKASLADPFSPSLGYNGHYGIPIKFDVSIGYWEWLTLGLHIGALFLLEKDAFLHMTTVQNTTDYFPLLIGQAEIDPGTIWEVSGYAKADHIWQGFSLLCGYTFTQKDKTVLEPKNLEAFDPLIANSNQRLKGWDMHVMHFNIDWDFAKSPCDVGPRVGLFYNLIIGGKRIYNTGIQDGYFGFDAVWCY